MKMGRGIRNTVREAVASSDGCSHLGELLGDVLEGLIQARFRLQLSTLGPEERARTVITDLKGTCRAFSDPERQPAALGDWLYVQASEPIEDI
jgi:hypothetical protein